MLVYQRVYIYILHICMYTHVTVQSSMRAQNAPGFPVLEWEIVGNMSCRTVHPIFFDRPRIQVGCQSIFVVNFIEFMRHIHDIVEQHQKAGLKIMISASYSASYAAIPLEKHVVPDLVFTDAGNSWKLDIGF